MPQPAPVPAAVLILAAGYSRRFGEDKRQARLQHHDGGDHSLLETTVLRLAALGWPMTLVLRADDQVFGETLRRNLQDHGRTMNLTFVYARDSNLGMGHSLAAGAAELEQQNAQRVLIALGDMPWLRTETLTLLAAALQELDPTHPGVVRPRYRGQAGHPVGLSGLALTELRRLSGDSGARALLRDWAAVTRWLDVDDPGVVHDVDQPADLERR